MALSIFVFHFDFPHLPSLFIFLMCQDWVLYALSREKCTKHIGTERQRGAGLQSGERERSVRLLSSSGERNYQKEKRAEFWRKPRSLVFFSARKATGSGRRGYFQRLLRSEDSFPTAQRSTGRCKETSGGKRKSYHGNAGFARVIVIDHWPGLQLGNLRFLGWAMLTYASTLYLCHFFPREMKISPQEREK